eukprot:TRINITY_DN10918_c0_g1_i1.p1 TRINITY_DN10918_c0_g1~~TRINITY_DN10918_c0_g1_i1.p1  ORF type:complete len:280 (-),score=13.03 TRINITY_DN10918_c0_g1_i1:213-1052(-)
MQNQNDDAYAIQYRFPMVQEFSTQEYSSYPPGPQYCDDSYGILGSPLQSRASNEEKWQILSENRYFAIVGASAVTHCYPVNMTYDTERILTQRFQQDVETMFQELRPPDRLTTQQKIYLQQILEKLEKTWNSSYRNMTCLHDTSNRFMAFNTNMISPACNVPSYLQHKFRALAHTVLKILHLPIVEMQQSGPPPRISQNLSFWKEVRKRFAGDNRTILKGWLLMHFSQPYPTDEDKKVLAQITGMSRTQLGNWFINQRVRWWRPMVESIVKELQIEEQP